MGGDGCRISSYGMFTDVNEGLVFYIGTTSGQTSHPLAAPRSIWDGSWHHVAGTFDGTKVRIYLDGVQQGSGTSVPVDTKIDYSFATRSGAIGDYAGECNEALAMQGDQSTAQGLVDFHARRHDVERHQVALPEPLGLGHQAPATSRARLRPRGSSSFRGTFTAGRYHPPPPRGPRVVCLRPRPEMRMKTYVAKPTDRERNWLVVDAEGQTLGRLATQIADALRGKRKPTYTPHIDTGDFVVVVNAEKIAVTGQKRAEKMYYRHSGYPGGLKSRTLNDMLERRPEEVIRLAVKGMMPRNRLGRKQLTKLKVYAGPDHPHAAQQPQPMALIEKK